MAARLFFSYSHKDETLRDQFEVHLAMLKREGLIEAWHDRRIVAGSELDFAIRAELDRADIVLFLVSPDFLASDYCYAEEAGRALERHGEGSARVIPVILRPCEWHRAPFGKLLATPTDGRPITKWPDRDDAFLDVTRAIRHAIEAAGKVTDPAIASGRPSSPPTAVESEPTPLPRSSNMRVSKTFNQRDHADFLNETFEFVANFFEGSLKELEQRNASVETRFRRIDADRFTAIIYQSGNHTSACTIFRGGLAGGTTQICYAMNENAATNGFNEAVSVGSDEQSLFMTTMGMSHTIRGGEKDAKLSPEGVAETFWSILMEPLQRPR
ncbi:MAG: toll/interleukin-1 receptor domain-containing protein [Pseudomonadota bacterium]